MARPSGFDTGLVPRILVAATALASVCVLALSAGGVAGARAGSAHSAGAVSDSIPWGACNPPATDLQCARIRVPLDWDRPNGRTIRLAVIRHLASKPPAQGEAPTLFVNPGGPGDTGVGLVRGDPEGIDAVGGGRFNVVSWDPRGTNASTRVRCFRSEQAEDRFWAGVGIPTTRAASKRYADKTVALARRCGQVRGWLLPHISTADTARDLDYLRRLSGERKLTYVGLSYGTLVGQIYANMFPGRVRAMLLDGIVDPVPYSKNAEARAASQAAGSDEVFSRFLALCQKAGHKRCALAGGKRTAAERVKRLFARLRRGSVIPAPGVPGVSPGRLNYGDLLLSQFTPMRKPTVWPQDAKDLNAAIHGDGSALEAGARPFRAAEGYAGATISSAISCADAPARRGIRSWPRVIGRLNRVDRLQGRVTGWWLWAPCASWPVRGQDSYRGPWDASTPNPILVISTRHDPNTPYISGVRVARRLGNAVLLTHNGYGHVSFQDPSTCVEEASTAYLVHLVTPPRGTVCRSDRHPFDPHFGEPLP